LAATSVVGTLDTAMTLRFADDQGVDIAGLEPTSAFVPVAMRATGTGWPANGGSITLAIEDGYPSATGQAMALPAALLVRSMIADSKLVEGVASVGGVGEGGEITAVPNLLAYFRGLDSTDAPMVLVPEANLPQLMDLAVMGSFEALLTHQIFTAADLDGAAAIAIEQSDDTKRARLLFGGVQDLSATMAATDLVTNETVRERLEAILKLAPSHASAKVLLAAGAPGGMPDQLSRDGAVYALEQAASPVAKLMDGEGDPAVANVAVFGGAKTILTSVRPKLDKEAVTVADDLRTMIEKIEAYSRMNNRDSEQGTAMKESITTQWGGLRSAYNALRGQGGG
jgi:hypothetical protein